MTQPTRCTDPSRTDFERTLQQRNEIPLYSAVRLFEQLKIEQRDVLNHPLVLARAGHLDALVGVHSSVIAGRNQVDPAQLPGNSRAQQRHIDTFCELILEGMRRTDSTISPGVLKDSRGISLSSSTSLEPQDVKLALLRQSAQRAFKQIFSAPGDPAADRLIVDKLLELTTEKSGSLRLPLTTSIVGAFADLVVNPAFSAPRSLTDAQHTLLCRLFGDPGSSKGFESSIVSSFLDQAHSAALYSRLLFIKEPLAGKLPQELQMVKLSPNEKLTLSVVESLHQIQFALIPAVSDARAIDLSQVHFGDRRAKMASPYISSALIEQLTTFFRSENIEQVVHRTHNLGMENLRYQRHERLVPAAFARENQPRAIWPRPGYIELEDSSRLAALKRRPR